MPLLLTARIADADVRRLTLRFGQEARVGRSDWVELSLPEDDALAEEHFVVRCQRDASVETLGEQQTVAVDGDSHNRLTLTQEGDGVTEFVAGQTKFSIRWSPDFLLSAPVAGAVLAKQTTPRPNDGPRIAAVAESMSMSADAIALQTDPDTALQYVDRLQEIELLDDVIRFLAGFLNPPDAVAWAIQTGCLEGESPEPLIEVIRGWIDDVREENRMEVEKELRSKQPTNFAKWIGQAIVFSGGSLAPPDQPVIRPPSHLCGLAILTAHRWAVANQPDQSAAIEASIDLGRAMLARIHPATEDVADAARSETH